MSSLDRTKPYGVITGHATAAFEQNGLLYAGSGELLGTPKTVAKSETVVSDAVILTDQVVAAKAFLENILAGGALAKAAVYREAEANNQDWTVVKAVSADMGIVKFNYQKAETWRLPEEA
jgi:hypothetical protein